MRISLPARTLCLLLLLLGLSHISRAQCAGAAGNCSCDSDCWLYGDCCPDVTSAHPDIRPTEPVYPPFPGSGNGVSPMACNVNASICTPGVSPSFNFDQNTPGPPVDFANPVGCSTGIFGNPNGFGFIVLNITGTGRLNLLVNGNSNLGFIDVVIYNIPPGVSPCTAVMSSANEIGCNYATASVGCTQFGNSFAGCASAINPAPMVTAGQQIMVIVHDYSSQSNSFTLQLATGAGLASTGPPNATINPPANPTPCVGSAPFTFTAVSNGGTWSGPGMSPNGTFNPATAGVGTHTINYAVGQAPCNSASTTQITVVPAPATAFTTNAPVCTGQTLNLTAVTGPAGATYHWTGPGGWTATGASPARTGATAAMSGTYTMYMVAGGCTSATATQNVVINATAPAPAFETNSPVCHGTPLLLDGPTQAGAEYFWSGPNGWTSQVEDPSIPATDYGMTGTYSLYIVTGGCTSAVGTRFVEISVPPKPHITPVPPVCFGGDVRVLSVDLPGGIFHGDNLGNNLTGNLFDPVAAGPGTHRVIYTIPEPCGSADTLDIIVSSPLYLEGTVVNETCPEVGDGAVHITVTGAPGPFTYAWSNGSTTQDLQGVILGNYTVTVSDIYGCGYGGAFTVGAGHSVNFSYMPKDVLCSGQSTGAISIQPLSGTPPYTYFVNGHTYHSSPIQPLYAGIYDVEIRDSKGCDTSFTLQINEPALLFADSTAHQIALGDHTTFSPSFGGGTGNLTLEWTPEYNLGCGDCPAPMAWPDRDVHYTYTVTDANGCTETGRVTVLVYHDGPFIPNSFTPGKDELNNVWKISDYGVKTFEVSIFNRWGNRLYRSENIYEGWDGKLGNGHFYESGVYVYKTTIHYIDGKEKTLTGHITLLR